MLMGSVEVGFYAFNDGTFLKFVIILHVFKGFNCLPPLRMMLGGRETASILRRGIFAVNKTKDYTSAELLNHLKRIIMTGKIPLQALQWLNSYYANCLLCNSIKPYTNRYRDPG